MAVIRAKYTRILHIFAKLPRTLELEVHGQCNIERVENSLIKVSKIWSLKDHDAGFDIKIFLF